MIHTGDCLDIMPTLDAESIDAIVTDPPYGLAFMGKHWDHGLPGSDFWREALRVARPGAYLLAFGGTRTVHRLACAIEDAGWIIRDMLVWGYASGFPKGRANLKPAWEPIVMARKPGPLRPLDIDGCRIEMTTGDREDVAARINTPNSHRIVGADLVVANGTDKPREPFVPTGRWPANVILTDPIFDGGWDGVVGGGISESGISVRRNGTRQDAVTPFVSDFPVGSPDAGYGDSGTYSRFFLIPKAARSDREPVLGGLPLRDENFMAGLPDPRMDRPQIRNARANVHPTVKPTELMRHLVRLVTPQGGTVLDPFLGSGTTALAAEMEGFAWVGIEREPEYVAIAEARLNGTQKGLAL